MKRWLKKWLPSSESMHRNKSLRWLFSWFHEHPYLFSLNRRTVAKGVAAGLLVAFIPLPGQIFLAGVLAFVFHANLPIAVVSTLITNPLTFVPITYMIYQVGTYITQSNDMNSIIKIDTFEFHWYNFRLIWQEIGAFVSLLGKNYLVGLAFVSLGASLIGYFLINIIWKISILWHLRSKKHRKKHH